MTEDTVSLATVYRGWDNHQRLLIQAITTLSADQLALRAAPQLRSIGMLATHIIAVRARWFHRLMGEGGAELASLSGWDRPDAPARNAAELVSGLETSWQVIQDALQRWTLADLEYIFQGTYQGEEYSFSRQWVIWHVIEHDLHHGGELSFSLGMHGLDGLDL